MIDNQNPPEMEPEPEIGGRLSRLKPVHYLFIGAALIVVLLILPPLVRMLPHQSKPAEDTAAGGSIGTRWSAPLIPIASKPMATPPPMPQAAPSVSSFGRPASDPGLTAPMGMAHNSTPISMGGMHMAEAQAPDNDDPLAKALQPTKLQGFRATRIRDPQWVVPQGTVIACTDITAMNSQLPGFITAVLPNNVWSMDGSNILLPRGSTMFGEMAHGLANGADRVFVLWRQITTPRPDFVRIELNSPAADELGRSGLDGNVNHHLWRKIGATLLISAVESGLQGASAGLTGLLNSGQPGSTNLNFYQLQGNGQNLANQYYATVANIPDVLDRLQGQPCTAFVQGDLDFSEVYKDVVR